LCPDCFCVVAAYKAADVDAKWAKTAEAKKIAIRKARANATDFDRFKLRHAKKVRASVVQAAVAK
jgi:large subunit ribosomal protein L14e